VCGCVCVCVCGVLVLVKALDETRIRRVCALHDEPGV
jgi:hypothetical protein